MLGDVVLRGRPKRRVKNGESVFVKAIKMIERERMRRVVVVLVRGSFSVACLGGDYSNSIEDGSWMYSCSFLRFQ